MKRKMVLMAAAMMLISCGAFAEEFRMEENNVIAALKASLPDAAVDYAVRERDDGRYEWDLFFTLGDQLGECEVIESSNEVRKVTLYEKPEGALTASKAMALLAQKKGDVKVIELELNRDDGRICYEGEAELDGRRYEFEMLATGEIIEWERD